MDIYIVMLDSYIRNISKIFSFNSEYINNILSNKNIKYFIIINICIIILGLSIYGFVLGYWRGWEQSWINTIKMPLLIIGTLTINIFINNIAGYIFYQKEISINFSQSLFLNTLTYAIFTYILLGYVSILGFVIYNIGISTDSDALMYSNILNIISTGFIAIAGVLSQYKLYTYIQNNKPQSKYIFLRWLLLNLIVGAQIAWNIRPFIGNPALPVEFFRKDAFDGTFYESILHIIYLFFNT